MNTTLNTLTVYKDLTLKPEIYNKFFNPNICHVCKLTNCNYFTCSQCFMISYCNETHKLAHQNQHMQICTALSNFLWRDGAWFTRQLSREEWIKSRIEFVHAVRSNLARDLEPYETQMILFAKSCLICHQQMNLFTCVKCYSVNYCSVHATEFINRHSASCEELLLYLNIIINSWSDIPLNIKFTMFPGRKQVVDMNSFIKKYVKHALNRNYNNTNFLYEHYIYADYVSGPLTLYYGMQKINLLSIFYIQQPVCVIHIIGVSNFDKKCLPTWEILLHCLHQKIQNLKIILIGPEMNNEHNYLTLCNRCKERHQTLSYLCCGKFYYDYVNSELYIRPNVIVGFQVDLSFGDLRPEMYLKLYQQCCPLILTAQTKLISEQNSIKITKALNSPFKLVYLDENKFSSLMPCKAFDGSVSYLNKYLSIYLNSCDNTMPC